VILGERREPRGFAPTGRRWELGGVDFHEYRDGRVCMLRIAFDMLSVSRQLGVMPAAGSRAERALAMAMAMALLFPRTASNPGATWRLRARTGPATSGYPRR